VVFVLTVIGKEGFLGQCTIHLRSYPSLWLSEREFDVPFQEYRIRVLDDAGEELKIENCQNYTPQGSLKFTIKPFHQHNSLSGHVFGKRELATMAEYAKSDRKASKLSIPKLMTTRKGGVDEDLGVWNNYWVSEVEEETR
jgi:hypothetical protein